MSGPFTRDSISSGAAYYSNPYRQDLSAKQGFDSIQAQKRHPEVILSHQDRLESHLAAKFRQNHFRLPSGGFVIIAQVGKYTVLAILLPAYIFFYGGPKWLFEHLATPFGKALEKTGAAFLQISAWTQDVFAIALNRLKSLLARKAQRKVKAQKEDNLFQELGKDLAAKARALFSSISNFAKTTYHKADALKRDIAQYFLNAHLKFQKGWNFSREKLADANAFLEKWLSDKASQIKNAFLPKLKFLDKIFEKSLIAIARPFKKAIEALTLPIYRLSRAAYNKVIEITTPFFAMIEERLKKAYETSTKAVETIKNIAEALARPVIVQLTAGLAFMQGLGLQAAAVMQRMQQNTGKKLGVVKIRFQDGFKSFTAAAMRLMKPLQNFIRKAFDESKKQAKKKFETFKKGMIFAGQKLKLAAVWTIKTLKKTPSVLFNALKRFLKFSWHLLKKVLWAIRVGLTWIKILVQYSEAFQWLRPQQQSPKR